jgi:hypothetical protein
MCSLVDHARGMFLESEATKVRNEEDKELKYTLSPSSSSSSGSGSSMYGTSINDHVTAAPSSLRVLSLASSSFLAASLADSLSLEHQRHWALNRLAFLDGTREYEIADTEMITFLSSFPITQLHRYTEVIEPVILEMVHSWQQRLKRAVGRVLYQHSGGASRRYWFNQLHELINKWKHWLSQPVVATTGAISFTSSSDDTTIHKPAATNGRMNIALTTGIDELLTIVNEDKYFDRAVTFATSMLTKSTSSTETSKSRDGIPGDVSRLKPPRRREDPDLLGLWSSAHRHGMPIGVWCDIYDLTAVDLGALASTRDDDTDILALLERGALPSWAEPGTGKVSYSYSSFIFIHIISFHFISHSHSHSLVNVLIW